MASGQGSRRSLPEYPTPLPYGQTDREQGAGNGNPHQVTSLGPLIAPLAGPLPIEQRSLFPAPSNRDVRVIIEVRPPPPVPPDHALPRTPNAVDQVRDPALRRAPYA